MVTLAVIYAAHGVSVEGGITTMPDYIGVELAFISFLLENGKERDAADFARQHPAVWIDDFCRKALEYAETDYYKGLLTSLPDLVKLFV